MVIIGIIAAITIPVVMANHRKTETASRLKKFYSTLSNAVKLSEAEWGMPSYEWGDPTAADYTSSKKWFEKYYGKYLSYMKIEKAIDNEEYYNDIINIPFLSDNTMLIYLNDGSILFHVDVMDNPVIDVNGDKGPNRWGRDIFPFYILLGNDDVYGNLIYSSPHVNTLSWNEQKTKHDRSYYLDNCKAAPSGSGSGLTETCTYLIQIDGWEIKNDYPHRI